MIFLSHTLPLAAIFAFRMLGLFMLIPVFSVLALPLEGATPSLIGIALGIYGLSQGILQIPFGMLSDKYGRKLMITLGLVIFALGSLLGALSQSIYGMIIARALQGCGAIGSVLIALVADLTPENHITKAMAIIGLSIGLSFSLAMIISPLISQYFGLSGIFFLTTFLALLGLGLLHGFVPSPEHTLINQSKEKNIQNLKCILTDANLRNLNLGILLQHLILTSTFYAIPLMLVKQSAFTEQWHLYLLVMIAAFILMLPFIIIGEKKQKMPLVFIGSISTIALSQLLLAFYAHSLWKLGIVMLMYFVAFNLLEAMLPSLISKKAPPHKKGAAMGIYSTCQFLGIFIGGTLSGLIFQLSGIEGIFLTNSLLCFVWILIELQSTKP